jgi:hypothetical protein
MSDTNGAASTSLATADEITKALAFLDQVDITGLYSAFVAGKVDPLAVAQDVDEAMQVAGVFFPPVATIANDAEVAIKIANGLRAIWPMITMFALPIVNKQVAAADQTPPAFTTAEKR